MGRAGQDVDFRAKVKKPRKRWGKPMGKWLDNEDKNGEKAAKMVLETGIWNNETAQSFSPSGYQSCRKA